MSHRITLCPEEWNIKIILKMIVYKSNKVTHPQNCFTSFPQLLLSFFISYKVFHAQSKKKLCKEMAK